MQYALAINNARINRRLVSILSSPAKAMRSRFKGVSDVVSFGNERETDPAEVVRLTGCVDFTIGFQFISFCAESRRARETPTGSPKYGGSIRRSFLTGSRASSG
jgi:hypothetical protein